MKSLFRTALLLTSALVSTAAIAGGHAAPTIGSTTALIAEASMADEASELMDGKSGDTDFPFLSGMKALATVGEVDAETGLALTGYPDGQAAWLADQDTIRVAYQSESYATMSSETYGWEMTSGVKFTGSHIHTIDYDRAAFADFLSNDTAAADMVKGSGKLFNKVFNVFGEEVKPRAEGGTWGNMTTPAGEILDFAADFALTEGDFFFQSFCGAFLEKANKWGDGMGFADDIWLTAEEWNIGRMWGKGNEATSGKTMGLASVAVDVANGVAYTAPALGQSGYEKIMPINPQHKDYVVMVMAGYNHGVEPTPLRIYVGVKGKDAMGNTIAADAPARDQFLARNGMLYGKIYGLALANDDFAALGLEADTSAKMLDAYMTNPEAPNTFAGNFVATSYQWGGWDKPVSVNDTEINLWQMASEQPEGHTFFVGDSKTEHPATTLDMGKTAYYQNMTNKGGVLAIELPNIAAELAAANGELPTALSANAVRTIGGFDGALTLEVADKGIKTEGAGTHAVWEDGRAMTVAPDGLMLVKGSDGEVLIIDEDSGNDYGERKLAVKVGGDLMNANGDKGYFLAMAGGKKGARATAGVATLAGTFKKANSSEFSGTWNLTAMVAKKDDGSFYTIEELAGAGEQAVNEMYRLNEQTLLGVVQHKQDSAGVVKANKADQGGQVFVFSLNLPQ